MAPGHGTPREETLPALALLVLGLVVGALVCAGRVDLPLTQALSSRYVSFANSLWLGLLGLGLGWLTRRRSTAWTAGATLLFVAGLLTGGTLRAVRGYQNGVALSERVAWTASVVLQTYPRVPPPALLCLNHNRPEVVQKHLPLLESGRLSLFADQPTPGRRRRAPGGGRGR